MRILPYREFIGCTLWQEWVVTHWWPAFRVLVWSVRSPFSVWWQNTLVQIQVLYSCVLSLDTVIGTCVSLSFLSQCHL